MRTFRLRTLLFAIALAAVGMFLLTVAPRPLAPIVLIALWVMMAALATTVVIYKRGGVQAFGIGALFPTGGTVLALTWVLAFWLLASFEMDAVPRLIEYLERMAFPLRVWSVAGGMLSVVCGFVSVAARAYFAKPEQ